VAHGTIMLPASNLNKSKREGLPDFCRWSISCLARASIIDPCGLF
jgi:hypothetical protein